MTERTALEERQIADRHLPVMLDRCLELLTPGIERPGAVLVDCTLGMGGHAEALLTKFPGLTLIGIDRDPQAQQLAGRRLARFGQRFIPVQGLYDDIAGPLALHHYDGADGILFDLGVSSFQLDERDRGFAYSYDAPLDMRMNPEDRLTAAAVLNNYSEEELRRILKTWGEEKFAARIAAAILAARKKKPLETTAELVDLIKGAVPLAAQRKGGHPAKRTFQAIRIEVNHELEVLKRAIPNALDALKVGGRLVAMSYHSLEDKVVKQAIAARAQSKAPKGFPVELEEHQPDIKVVTRGAEPPTAQEIAENSRAASAKLRAAEKIKSVKAEL